MDYLQLREEYKVALHRSCNYEAQLMERYGATCAAHLESLLQEQRSSPEVQAAISEMTRLDLELDKAADRYDTARMWAERRAAAAQKQLDKVFATTDC